ncbi:MAG: Gfo/Idh/MocA family oxidoreductase [Acidobacteria bacterium]|nr:Gfo/Idh/MocA family oxidoreductase [Acidobacteriota bacterium]
MSDHARHDLDRRDFLKAGAAGAAAALATMRAHAAERQGAPGADSLEFRVKPIDPVRIGYVGVGLQGSSHVQNLLHIPGVEIRAVCDIVPEKVARVQQWVVDAGQPKPEGYANGPEDFKRLCHRNDLDLVYTATPWEWHVPVCVAAMEAGKHAATEVPAAYTIEDCWRLVETAERTHKHCIQMENCCYDRPEMLCLNLVKKGLLGEILHAEAGYCHDLRAIKFENKDEGLWRLAHSISRNGNLYPTHGLGPVAQCLDINRGDRFDYLVSVSSPSRGLQAYAANTFGATDSRATRTYKLGDVNVSLIQTALGKVITLYHDTNLPRPYSRIHHVQGTQGLFEKYPNRVYVEGRGKNDQWDDLAAYQEFDHPLWKTEGDRAKGAGHGGMDYLEDYRLISALRNGQPLDMDVYDAAAISAVTPLSEQSVARRGAPMAFPDFMKGRWKTPRVLHVMELL